MAPEALSPKGRSGEDLACRHLERSGLLVLARNFRSRWGELDVVAREGEQVVFVEVKERHGASHGAGLEAVVPAKRRRMVLTAQLYASKHGLTESHIRFDVISIDWGTDGKPRIRHDRGAFDADGR